MVLWLPVAIPPVSCLKESHNELHRLALPAVWWRRGKLIRAHWDTWKVQSNDRQVAGWTGSWAWSHWRVIRQCGGQRQEEAWTQEDFRLDLSMWQFPILQEAHDQKEQRARVESPQVTGAATKKCPLSESGSLPSLLERSGISTDQAGRGRTRTCNNYVIG